ncbi:MAG TPA: 16S rRNA (cytidine(1402)-2'-O)-methyltransferase [Candidatus Paceibacterota bacterium]|nr:16S rRNA (cytidine(1402)-2'-O)-methyltransferase [Candidatus Paceibacterota bacterium]
MAARLSIVATPIGNLEDITLRALRLLKEADVVACEDTRNTKKLLSHFEISTPLVSFHAHSGEAGFSKIISLLEEGKRVCLVSDAGTPGVSDPGLELVSVVREHFTEGITIEAVPGASALAAAISVAGMRAASFTFYGFLPLKKGRETIMKEIANSSKASVFYESPHRIHKSVKLLITFLQAREEEGKEISDRRVGIFRELTKLHEESFVGSPSEALAYLESDPNHQRGEFVVIVEGASRAKSE